MAKEKLDKTKIYLVAAIRRIFRWSKNRTECLRNAKRCYVCKEKADKYQADHVEPVGTIPRSWVGWDQYLRRMFEGELRPICKPCHKVKSKREADERKKARLSEPKS